MKRKIFSLDIDSIALHNLISIKPKADLRIISINTILSDGSTFPLLDDPVSISEPTAIRYSEVESSRVNIEIEGLYVDELSLPDLAIVDISSTTYGLYGSISSPETKMSFHRFLSIVYDIRNVKDVIIKGTLGIKTLDRYENIVYTETIPISFNDDGWLVEHQKSGDRVCLPIEASEVKVLIGSKYIEDFSIDGKDVIVDIPDGASCFILYKPSYLNEGSFSQMSENISVDGNGQILLRDDRCESILYSMNLEVYNTDITSLNHTPIIKSLAVVSSDK